MGIRLNDCVAAGVLLLLLHATPAVPQMQHGDAHAGPAMNFHRIDDRLATGGHFVDDGLERLQKDGLQVVIDLRDEPPAGQEEKLARLGIEYINIPVVWRDPQPADYQQFKAAMATHQDAHVLVQCQANYRASAMTYLYRVKEGQASPGEAQKDLHTVWKPEGRWREFMDDILD